MTTTYRCGLADEREPGIEAAVAAVARGELVVLPTDTRYGLGADAFRPEAVEALRRVRGTGRDTPVPVLVGSARTLDGLTLVVDPVVRTLVAAFWPGPLTVVVPHSPSLAWDLGDARGTVAVRMPLHPVALAVLERTGPMAVSGAHRAGWPAPGDAAAARAQLGDAVAVYLEAGARGAGAPSTVVDATGAVPRVLRAGALSLADLRAVVPSVVTGPGVVASPVPWEHDAGTGTTPADSEEADRP